MKRTPALSIGEIIDQYIRAENLETELNEQRALSVWVSVVGRGINKYTISRSIKEGVMTVKISSAPLRNELMLNRSAIIQNLNSFLGAEVVKEIIFK